MSTKLIPVQVEMYSGERKQLVITVLDENDAAVSLASATAKFAIARSKYSATPLVEKETGGSGIQLTDAAAGELTVTLDPADTEALREGLYYMECEVTDVSGNPNTVLVGDLSVKHNLL